MVTEIALIMGALILVAVFASLVSTLVITTPSASQPTPSPASVPVMPAMYWSENLRGNRNFELFPPCFQRDPYGKNIYGILARYNMVDRYYSLLDIMSLLLCLEEAQTTQCKATNIKDRMVQLTGMGANPNDEEARKKASAFITVNESDASRLLVGAMHLLERQAKVMIVDKDIARPDIDQITGHLYSFYASHYPTIAKLCA